MSCTGVSPPDGEDIPPDRSTNCVQRSSVSEEAPLWYTNVQPAANKDGRGESSPHMGG